MISQKKRRTITNISIELISASHEQPRSSFNDQKIKELALSIETHGILQPILVRKLQEGYEIIAGERRWRAARIARLKSIPAIIMDLQSSEALAIALIENIQREDLNAIEEALAYKKLRETLKISQDEVAQRVGKDRASVANALRLLRLPEQVQAMVIQEDISMGHARALLSLEHPDMMMMVAKKAIREGLSVRKVEGIIRALKNGYLAQDERKNISSPLLSSLEREIQQKLEYALETKVELKKDQNNYLATIYFHSAEQLNALLDRLGIEI
jgi:ParB family chromosome partitioning protein